MTSTEIPGAEYAAKAAWENTVIPGQENHSAIRSRPSQEHSGGSSRALRNPLSTTNGTSLNRKSSREGIGQSNPNSGDTQPPPRRIGDIGRQESSISKTGSEADSVLDLYGQPSSRSNSKVDLEDRRNYEKVYLNDNDREGKWIHRDKLAKIESEELQAAGINLPTSVRAVSRSGNRRGRSQDDANSVQSVGGDQAHMPSDARPFRSASPVDESIENERMNWDLRTPEEIAADPLDEKAAAQMYAHPVVRKSGSRIPVLSSSTPRTKKRNASNAADEDGQRYRSRANSQSSQVLLDDVDPLADAPPTPAIVPPPINKTALGTSPTKGGSLKSPTTGGIPSPAVRKASAPTSSKKVNSTTPKSRSASANTANASPSTNRPGTRSGEERPRTAVNRPEGDPPWLATMYKPDPRLPPDQQIIPTHARRQQQAQWTEEGAIPTTYDRDFSPLAIHTSDGLKPSTPSQSPTKDDAQSLSESNQEIWPLRTLSPTVQKQPSSRPGTSGTDHGGYSTMPNIRKSPQIGTSPKIGSNPSGLQRIQQPVPPSDDEEKGESKKKGGCGCCIVM